MKPISAVVLFIAVIGACEIAHAQTIEWEIVNRFRVMEDENAHNRLIANILAARDAGTYRQPLVAKRRERGIIGDILNHRLLPTKWDERKEQYDIDWAHKKDRQVRIKLNGLKPKSKCKWRLGSNVFEQSSCAAQVKVFTLNTTTAVTVEVSRGGEATKTLTAEIYPKDLFVAVLGDSYASGEGNPHLTFVSNQPDHSPQPGYPAIWWDTRCHRSLMSSAAQAAAFYAERNKQTSVTFVSYACSGAEINTGILKGFEGRQTVKQTQDFWTKAGQPDGYSNAVKNVDGTTKLNKNVLKSQIARLEELLCPSVSCADADKRRPDILFVVIGGNDIGFGEIGRALLMSNPTGDLDRWKKDQKTLLSPLFQSLAKDFRTLAAAVKGRIAPKNVLVMQYVDPTMYTDSNGRDRLCGKNDKKMRAINQQMTGALNNPSHSNSSFAAPLNVSLYNLLLTKGEAELAQWVVQELNRTIKSAAAEKIWTDPAGGATLVEVQNLKGPDDTSRGVCSNDPWFVTIVQSELRQDWITSDPDHTSALKLNSGTCAYEVKENKCMVPAGNITSGILHPNFFGHYNIGQVIRSKIVEIIPGSK